MADNIILNNVLMTQSTGQKSNMPAVAPDGKLLVVRDTGKPTELWCGTGTGVEQISGGGGGNGFNLFDIIMKDHVLSYAETLGLAPLGTYVYKEAIAGTRYGYPDFYQKCVAEYNESTSQSEYTSSNYAQMIGTITDNEGVLSGFSNGNYIFGGFINIPTGATWEYVTKFNSSDHSTINVLGGFGNEQGRSLSTNINTDGTLSLFLSSNSSTWDIVDNIRSSSTLSDNTDYYIKRYFTGAEYKLDISTTGAFAGEEINYITVNSTTSIFSTDTPVDIAGWMNSGTFTGFRGTIDLNGCYININGERWWTGTDRLDYKQSTNKHRFYDITDKATFDNMYAITGEAWYYGIDTTNERIFLPRSTRFRNGTSLDVGGYQAAGLPNITGMVTNVRSQNGGDHAYSGAFYNPGQNGEQDQANGGSRPNRIGFDASLSNPIYGASNTVEYASTKLIPYMVVGNVANVSAATDVVDITTSENDTLPLGFSTYQGEGIQPSPAWLKSSGQWNSGEVYATFYNYYVAKIGDDFGAGKVVDSDDPYTDYDLVLNQTEQTFRLPLLNGSESVVSDKYDTYSNVVNGNTYIATANGWFYIQGSSTANAMCNLGLSDVNTPYLQWHNQTNTSNQQLRGYLQVEKDDEIVVEVSNFTNVVLRFVYAQGAGSLYFKVANAVQNLELLDAGAVIQAVNDLIPNNSSLIAGYAMPSDTYEDLVLGASGTTYTAPANGWVYFEAGTTGNNQYIELINTDSGLEDRMISTGSWGLHTYIPVKKNGVYQVNYTAGGSKQLRFIYAQGSESEAN